MSARNVEQEFDALKSDFGKLSTDLVSLTAALRELTGKEANDTLAKLHLGAEHAKLEAEAAAAALALRGRESMTAVASQMRSHPLTSILICFGLGVILGKVIDR